MPATIANLVTPVIHCVHRGGRRHSSGWNRKDRREVAVTPADDGGPRWGTPGLAATALGEFATPEAVIRREGVVPLLNAYKHLKGMFEGKLNDPFMIEMFANTEKGNSEGTSSSLEVVHRTQRAN